MQIVAREVGSSDQLHSSARVTVNLLDRNDNPPVFESDKYEVDVHENEENGKVILKVGLKRIVTGFEGDVSAVAKEVFLCQSGKGLHMKQINTTVRQGD